MDNGAVRVGATADVIAVIDGRGTGMGVNRRNIAGRAKTNGGNMACTGDLATERVGEEKMGRASAGLTSPDGDLKRGGVNETIVAEE
jgi:hypothetical protein